MVRYTGAKVHRMEDPRLLTGHGRYVDDIHLPGMLHAAFLRSSHAHARIHSIDASAALALPGVHGVFTQADLGGDFVGQAMSQLYPAPVIKQDKTQYPLASGEVCFVGQTVAVVVADSRALAEDALAIDEESFVANLRKRRGQIKNTLVNQKFIAGIGNAYSDEILWEAQIHPHRRGNTLKDEDPVRLYRAMRATFEWAMPFLEAEVSEGLYQLNEEWRDHLRVHRQEGCIARRGRIALAVAPP